MALYFLYFGLWRVADVLDAAGIKPSVALNSAVCETFPKAMDEMKKRGWEFMGHGTTNSENLAGLAPEKEKEVIQHVLKTIEQRWNLKPLTARDKAAAGLGDVLTLATPRTDDPLQGVTPPTSNIPHPNQSQPSRLEKLHARKVSQLQLRNDKGSYDDERPLPDLSSTASIGDFIQTRTAAWTQHLQRQAQRRSVNVPASTAPPAKKTAAGKPARRRSK